MLGLYDEEVFYRWTLKEWFNRMQGARLAEIDKHERAIEAAWVSGIVARVQKPKPPNKYFDAKKARHVLLNATTSQEKVDFTLYDRAKEGLKKFDWKANYTPKK